MAKKNYSVFSDAPLEKHIQESKEKMAAYDLGGAKKKYPVYLSLKPDEEAEIRFLESEPLKFYQHRVFDNNIRNGQGGYRVLTCTRRPDCPLCTAGNKATFKVAWQVVHLDNLDQNGDVVPRVKMWVQGIRFASLFEKKTKRFDIKKENVILERIGSGTDTTYSIERTNDKGKIKFDQDEITDLEEYFGLDDKKYEDMVRIGNDITASSKSNEEEDDFSEHTYRPKKSKQRKSRRHPADEESFVDDDNVPF